MLNVVEVGLRLRKKDAPTFILEIIELVTPTGDLPHARARVSITKYDLGVRLYSVSALEDTRMFISLGSPARHIDFH